MAIHRRGRRPAQSGRDPAAESNPIEKVLANWAVGTDPGVHIGAVQAVLDAGAVPFLHFPQDDPITAIDFYRTNVLPELR